MRKSKFAGASSQALLERSRGGRVLAEQVAQQAEAIEDIGAVGQQLRIAVEQVGFFAAELLDFVGVALLLSEQLGQLGPRAGEIRLHPDRGAELFGRLLRVAELPVEHAEVDVRVRRVRD